MKKIIIIGILIFCGSLMMSCRSQNLLAWPESIIYDSLHHRYLISNCQTGDIIQVDSIGNQSYFAQGVQAIQGLEIVGNTVYVGCDSLIRGFDLETGAMVMNIHVTGVINLNDITADTSGNLYAGDVFSTKIIKVDLGTQNWWVFVNGNGIHRPNGIFFDKAYNRILVCSYRYHSPIQAISLADTSVTVLAATTLSDCDGITKDKYGRYYVTSWETNSIYRFDSAFSNPPTLVYTNQCGPADISYDRVHDVIAIPLQGCNSWDTLHTDPVVGMVENPTGSSPGSVVIDQCYPNPAKDNVTIEFSVKKTENISLGLNDVMGINKFTFLNEEKTPGNYSIEINLDKLNPGNYFINLKTRSETIVKKMIVL